MFSAMPSMPLLLVDYRRVDGAIDIIDFDADVY